MCACVMLNSLTYIGPGISMASHGAYAYTSQQTAKMRFKLNFRLNGGSQGQEWSILTHCFFFQEKIFS